MKQYTGKVDDNNYVMHLDGSEVRIWVSDRHNQVIASFIRDLYADELIGMDRRARAQYIRKEMRA